MRINLDLQGHHESVILKNEYLGIVWLWIFQNKI
jgi:hypothetical protein